VRALWTGGCAGLVGLVLGTLFPSGIPTTFALAGLIYLLAAWASPRSWPEVADQPDGHRAKAEPSARLFAGPHAGGVSSR